LTHSDHGVTNGSGFIVPIGNELCLRPR
jgi:hypothetical protein